MKKIIVLIMIGIIIGGLVAYGIIQHMAVQRAEKEIAQLVLNTPALEGVRYGKISVGLVQSTLGMQEIQLRLAGFQEPIHIDRFHLDVDDTNHHIPPRGKAEIMGIRLSTQHGLLEPVRADLEAMGYRNITGLIALGYTYDDTDKRLNLNDVNIRADQMGSVRFDLALTNLDLYQLANQNSKPDVATLLMVLPMVGLAGGRLTYADDSFLQRVVDRSSDPDGGQLSNYRLRSKEKLNTLLNDTTNDRVRRFLSSLRDFIDHPKSVTISLDPPKPVPFLRLLWMKKPADFLELLNVTISS